MKIYNLGLNDETKDKLYKLIQTDEFYDNISILIREFGEVHNWQWQAGFNGRGSGYLVLYQGEQKPSGYKSYCTKCGQKNYRSVTETGAVCGVCRQTSRLDFTRTHMSIHVFPGRSTDQYEDFADWDTHSLRERVELVCGFDALADAIVSEAVYMAENCDVTEENVYTPHTRKVLVGVQ